MKFNYKNHIFDLLLAILFAAIGILLLPVFPIATTILDCIVAFVLLLYLFGYLIRRFRGARNTILVLTIVEFAVIFLIALGLVLKTFNVFSIGETCAIIGLVMWLRGVVCLVKGYLISTSESRKKYSLLMFFGYIALVTAGTWLFVKPVITNAQLIWIICILSFIVAVVLLALAIKFWPKSKKAKKEKTEKNKSEKAKKQK